MIKLTPVERSALRAEAHGLKPIVMIGESGLDGVLVATGHHRNGILLTPVTADAIADRLAGDDAPAVTRPFDPARFQRSAVGAA